ncbi:MAG TPA: hypothetical protein VMV92_27190 [Streptosporangiaceae bacterium]|nr:hypothetical protein [Streptosporangiaceae bacterium]
MPGDELATNEFANDGPGQDVPSAMRRGNTAVPPGARTARSIARRLPGSAPRWLSIFGLSLGLFLIRLLVPVPVGQSDNRDGPRLMCGLGAGPVVPHGDPRFFRYIYFEYVSLKSCAGRSPYPSSEVVPLELTRLLTPVFGLPGMLNLIALGVLMCVLASVGIASLATGLRLRLCAQLLVAAAAWLIIADAAFFDVFASPFSEPAALVGLVLVAAGVVYLGRGWRETVFGLVLAGSGGFLAILSKEQYLVLAAPICLTVVLASADWSRGRGLQRLRTRQARAAVAVAGLLAVLAGGYALWDYASPYGQRLHHIQAVDMIFTDIVTKRATAPAELRALGLPASWARYAGHYYWDRGSVRNNPLYARYEDKLTDGNIARYLLTHPGTIISVGQQAAVFAQQFRVTTLGDYPPSAGYPKSTLDSRVVVLTWLVHRLPPGLGLLWLVPLWAVLAAVAIAVLALRRGMAWHRDGAVLVLCMTGCAILAFIPPAYFAGISTTRHMVGTNIATALASVVTVALAVSMIQHALARVRRRPEIPPAPAVPELAKRNS